MKKIKSNAGVWIDHREAIIVVLTETGEEANHIQSKVEKQLRHSVAGGMASIRSIT
jgi:hypothetical protein